MSEIVYIKKGRSRRLEIERESLHRLEIEEHGEAIERDRTFLCRTLTGSLPHPDTNVGEIPLELEQLLSSLKDTCEHATVIAGAAHHSCKDAEGVRDWNDRTVRVHLSMVNRQMSFRCEIDLGGIRFEETWADDIANLFGAVHGARPETTHPSRIALEPTVSAAMLAFLVRSDQFPEISLHQIPRPGEIDGRGRLIEPQRIVDPFRDESLPWFRPSYRLPPRALPHGLQLDQSGSDIDIPDTRAIALAGDPRIDRRTLRLPCLVSRDGESSLLQIEIDLDRWDQQVTVVGETAEWFPLLAGVWGQRLVVSR